jgi:hypothetical protein
LLSQTIMHSPDIKKRSARSPWSGHAMRTLGLLIASLSPAAVGCAADTDVDSEATTSQEVVVQTDEEGRGPSSALLGLTFEGYHVFSVRRAALSGEPVRCFYGLSERGAVPLTPNWVRLKTIRDRYPYLATTAFEAKATSSEAKTMTDDEQSSLAVFLYHVQQKRVAMTTKACPG